MWKNSSTGGSPDLARAPLPLADRFFSPDKNETEQTEMPANEPDVAAPSRSTKAFGLYAQLMHSTAAKINPPVKLEPPTLIYAQLMQTTAAKINPPVKLEPPPLDDASSALAKWASRSSISLQSKSSGLANSAAESSSGGNIAAVQRPASRDAAAAAWASLSKGRSVDFVDPAAHDVKNIIDGASLDASMASASRKRTAAEILTSYGAGHLDKDVPPVPPTTAAILHELLEAPPAQRANAKRSPLQQPAALDSKPDKIQKLSHGDAAAQPAAENSATQDLIPDDAAWKIGGGKNKSYLQVVMKR